MIVSYIGGFACFMLGFFAHALITKRRNDRIWSSIQRDLNDDDTKELRPVRIEFLDDAWGNW